MGCSFSCSSPSTFNNIRIVHLNGYVEDFEPPVTVGQVTGKPPKHIVCTRAQLMSGELKALKSDTQLEPGHVYFLLAYSSFQAEVSPMDLVSMARRLTKAAKTSRSESPSGWTSFKSSPHCSSPIWSSPAMSPNRFSVQCTRVEAESGVVAYGLLKSPKTRSWKPILDTIREKSFNRRSESELQENHLEASKIA